MRRISRPDELLRRASKRLEMVTLSQLNRRRRFSWHGETYTYCVDGYNSSWHNERTVEVPIARGWLDRHGGGRTLEVGNVLAHYGRVGHDVVDKYEQAPGVLNVDVVEFEPPDRYDLIISVSTLEHAGWDEDVLDERKPIRAVDHLISLLAPGGTLLATFPLGWNPHVDAALREDAFRLDEISYLKRVSRANRWREVPKAAIGEGRYNHPFPAANTIAIGISRA
jgi:SAM-dependent methyltransferase